MPPHHEEHRQVSGYQATKPCGYQSHEAEPVPVIDHSSDRPVYKQLADILRADIRSGALPAGRQLPAEPWLASKYEIGRDTVRDALALLRTEGMLRTVPRIGTFVVGTPERTAVELTPGDRVTVRMPTYEERTELRIPEGVPVFIVHRSDGGDELYRADEHHLEVPEGNTRCDDD